MTGGVISGIVQVLKSGGHWVELFFRWLKQTSKIRYSLGRSENARSPSPFSPGCF